MIGLVVITVVSVLFATETFKSSIGPEVAAVTASGQRVA